MGHRPIDSANGAPSPSLLAVFRVFLRAGATTFGGMWAATGQLERQLVERAGWLRRDELRASLVLATLIPAPRFLGLAGLVGFRVRGWRGALVGALGLIAPGSLMVLGAAVLIGPGLLAGPLASLTRTISLAIIAILFASAYAQLKGERGSRRQRTMGVALSAAIFGSVVLGLPLIAAAGAGFIVGALVLRPEAPSASTG
jgi:chromate transporter